MENKLASKYQIFISSTFEDLKEARDNVMKAVLTMGHIPLGMEMFVADGNDQWVTIQKTIDECDYFIVIIGHRYGTLAKDGKSYTEKEYRYAQSKGIPTLAFIREENVSLRPNERENNAEKQKKLRDFRGYAAKKLCNFWKSPDELAGYVNAAIYKNTMDNPRKGWIKYAEVEKLQQQVEKLQQQVKHLQAENDRLKIENSIQKERTIRVPQININIRECQFNVPTIEYNGIVTSDCNPLKINEIPLEYKKYISDNEIVAYNNALPSKDDIELYNSALKLYSAKEGNNFFFLPFDIENSGNNPAHNIRIVFDVPDGLVILRKWTVEHIKLPKSIIPENPLKKAKKLYKKELEGAKYSPMSLFPSNKLCGIAVHDYINMLDDIDPQILNNNNSYAIYDANKTITIRIEQLQHESQYSFNDDIMILPLSVGEFDIKANIMCDEYESSQTQVIHISTT